ncbi:sigma-70 family RNA polymerase sigma factor [Mycobacterium simiae]|uniref:sigma-70 family RNA polymerase sigma factor n=1 Tax=Mycobacterium simiae TaxID=1784 RepID=UPI0004102EFE|nr:sigma-70 family RNA polymerase sigma factor [Mycobacterium simiae]BBX43490.1 ECF RNA polymerase sigma factor SigH [Mycobacterium simiae]
MTTASRQDTSRLTARFEREVIPLLDDLYICARRLTRNHADAEDLIQDTMLKAYSHFGSWRHQDGNLKGWIYRIMRNTWVTNHRKTQHRRGEHLSSGISDSQQAVRAHHDSWGQCRSADVHVLEAVVDAEVTAALKRLPQSHQTTIYYVDVLGYRYREVADIMGIPIGTVMSRLHSARSKLRKSLAELAPNTLSSRVASPDRPQLACPPTHTD